MQIREANEDDIPSIISVLKQSIGESKLPKTEKIWRYKHLENPFGKSLVILAVVDNNIIGVRAFMKWEWRLKGIKFLALRAVDTGILPKFQRKGIFGKLNNFGLELAKERGENFIFNTPNSKSLPANLKIGWKKINKIIIRINICNPLIWLRKGALLQSDLESDFSAIVTEELLEGYNKLNIHNNKLFTPKSCSYLQWRYRLNPLQTYEIKSDKDFYLAAYIKEHKYFKELRIVEHIFLDNLGRQKVKKEVRKLSMKYGAQLITTSELNGLNFGLGWSGNYGPILTMKEINLEPDLNQSLLQIKNWSYTLGDLELF